MSGAPLTGGHAEAAANGSGWTPRSALRRALELYRAAGARAVWFGILEQTVYRRLLIVERDLAMPVVELPAKLPIELSVLTPAEAGDYAGLDPACGPDEARRRLSQGESCSIGRHDGRVIASCWTVAGRAAIPYLDWELPLEPGDAYLSEAWTAPAMRGQNVATARLAYDCGRLQAAGFRRVVAAVVPDNRQVLRPLDKTGFRPLGMVRMIRLGRWRRCVYRVRGAAGRGARAALPRTMRPPSRAHRALLRARSELALLRSGDGGIVTRADWGAARPRRPYAERGELDAVVLHHTSIPSAHLRGKGVRAEAVYMRAIQALHRSRGWFDVGYHFVVMPSGRVFAGRPVWAVGAHVIAHNRGTVGISLAGDFEQEYPTPEALEALDWVLANLVPGSQAVPLLGHRDLGSTRCPGRFLYPLVERRAGSRAASAVRG